MACLTGESCEPNAGAESFPAAAGSPSAEQQPTAGVLSSIVESRRSSISGAGPYAIHMSPCGFWEACKIGLMADLGMNFRDGVRHDCANLAEISRAHQVLRLLTSDDAQRPQTRLSRMPTVVDPKNWARIRASLPRRRSFRHARRTR
jgi:hypothetical protein